MPTDICDIGDLRRLSVNIQAAGVDADPTGLAFTITEPDGVATTWTYGTDAQVVKDSVGDYHADWPVAKPGRHFWRWAATGAAVGAEAGEFWARRKNTG